MPRLHCSCGALLDSNVQKEMNMCAACLSLMCKEWTREIRLDKIQRKEGLNDLLLEFT